MAANAKITAVRLGLLGSGDIEASRKVYYIHASFNHRYRYRLDYLSVLKGCLSDV